MIHFIKKYKVTIIAIIIGGILGYAYYYFVGCTGGKCSITSKPINSTIYGMVMAGLTVNIFKKDKPEKKESI